MNYNFIFIKVFIFFIGWGMITLSFHLSEWYYRYQRKTETKAATKWENFWYFIKYIVAVIIVAAIIGFEVEGYTMIFGVTLIIPTLWGLWGAIEKDSKLTVNERKLYNQKIADDIKAGEKIADY
jgi:hypothetical protein